MKQRIFTLLALAATLLTANAQNAGDYVYTDNGRFKIVSGENLLTNGDFSGGTDLWTTDGGTALSVDTFSVESGGPDGKDCLVVNLKENGPSTGSTLLRKLAVQANHSYFISYQVQGNDDAITTTITTGENVKNYQNIFFSNSGSLTADEGGQIAKNQTYGWDWSTISYGFNAPLDGYIVIHFFAPYIGTKFADFKILETVQVIDDREANAIIARLQAYLNDPRFPNGHDILEDVIATLQGFIESDDLNGYNDIIPYMDEAIDYFLDLNSAKLNSYVPNFDLDDLKTTSANQTTAGAWTIDDKLRETNPTGKTRWAVKAASMNDAPITGNYLQNDIPYGTSNKLYEATVYQTIENMPAGQYMFTGAVRGYKLKDKSGERDTDIHGIRLFINNDSTECYPVKDEKATSFTVYSTLSNNGQIKLGYHQDDAIANHIDLDFVSLRIIGWTNEQVDEFFRGKEFAEARAALKVVIDSARVHYNNPEMLYGKPQLDSAIVASQDYYENINVTDSLIDSGSRLKKEISNYISRNATLTALRTAIANAEGMLADNSYSEADRQKLQTAIEAAKAFLATLTAENHFTEGYTNDDIKAQTTLLNEAINALLSTKLKADEKYEFLTWAKTDGAVYTSTLLTGEEDVILTSSNATLYPETATFAGHSLNNRFAFLNENMNLSLNSSCGLQVNYTSKNKTTMAILNLKEGDQIDIDWNMANTAHNIMIVSANAKARLADGSWYQYTKTGKDNANVLDKDNSDGLSGSVRSTIIMTADGTLDFYQGSSNSAFRIYYIGITNAENVNGIKVIHHHSLQYDGGIYDLQGRKATGNKPGIYIRNRKKLVMK